MSIQRHWSNDRINRLMDVMPSLELETQCVIMAALLGVSYRSIMHPRIMEWVNKNAKASMELYRQGKWGGYNG